jgi:hypothetical protein
MKLIEQLKADVLEQLKQKNEAINGFRIQYEKQNSDLELKSKGEVLMKEKLETMTSKLIKKKEVIKEYREANDKFKSELNFLSLSESKLKEEVISLKQNAQSIQVLAEN